MQDIGPQRESFLPARLPIEISWWRGHFIRRLHEHVLPRGYFIAEQTFQNILLRRQETFRDQQNGSLRRHLGLSLLFIQRRQHAFLDSMPVGRKQFFRELQRLLLHAHVLLRQLQIVVGELHTRDGIHDLLAKAQPGNAQEFFADLDIQPRGIDPEDSSKAVAVMQWKRNPANLPFAPKNCWCACSRHLRPTRKTNLWEARR